MAEHRLIIPSDTKQLFVTPEEDDLARSFAVAELISKHLDEFKVLHKKHLERVLALAEHNSESLYISPIEIVIKK